MEKMKPDCKPVRGKVLGPDHHQLCSVHGHILDIKAKTIIAKDRSEYEKKGRDLSEALFKKLAQAVKLKMAPDCKPVSGKLKGLPAHIKLCGKHGHVLNIKSKDVLAKTEAEFEKTWGALIMGMK